MINPVKSFLTHGMEKIAVGHYWDLRVNRRNGRF